MNPIICIGEMLIDLIPDAQAQQASAPYPCYRPHPGGAPANVAVAIARLGGVVRFIGKLSEDGFGQLLARTLAENQVDTQYVRTAPQVATTLAVVTLQANGERQFAFYREGTADTQLAVEDLDWRAWENVAICHAGSVALAVEPARSAIFAAIDHTRQRGAIVSFDANIRPALWATAEDIPATMQAIVPRTDVLKFSAEEAWYMDEQEESPAEQLELDHLLALGQRLLERGPSLVIITRGAQGALLFTAEHQVEAPAPPVHPVDTTGAGDAFMGAVLYRLAAQSCHTPADLRRLVADDLHDVGMFANRVAGLSCTRYGGIASLPTMAEVESWS
jgi:fructokinase